MFFWLKRIIDKRLNIGLCLVVTVLATSANAKIVCPAVSPLLPAKTDSGMLLWSQWTVKSGQTLGGILDKFKVLPHEVLWLSKESDFNKRLTQLRIGDRLEIGRSPHTCAFKEARLLLNAGKYIRIEKDDESFQTDVVQKPIEVREQYKEIIVNQSLFFDGFKAGVPDKILIQLENIFGGHINFSTDLRKGDRFQLIYGQHYIDGKQVSNTFIQAVAFVGKAGEWEVVRFEEKKKAGYYTRKGENMETAFDRNPVRHVRISSRFHPKRLHPILHKIVAHRGVDYAAPTGTPIYATANGVITTIGYSNTYGNIIKIKHGRKYMTVYAHISRFKKGMRKNKKVNKGDVIAYVGSTGRSTGPHLHYELRYLGVHVDPLKVKLPRGKSITKKQKQKFLKQAENHWKTLEEKRIPYLAQGETAGSN